MKHTLFRVTAALMLAGSALAVTACGSNDTTTPGTTAFDGGTDGESQVAAPAPSTTAAPNLATPTVAELNEKITKAFDASIDPKTKVEWVENAGQDPQLVTKLVDAAKQNDVTVEIVSVGQPKDGKLTADAKLTIAGKPVENATVAFVAEGNEWKVDHAFACTIVQSAKLDSAACQE
ncbi:hypothetical protein [Nocardia huaxiensis]|uniref:Low molecular weight antigen MTB12-like C-terminal domain-containing protein n=1 Tax=Nocardia huaxiensis TaxID=2755382 RepID=A0A7D6ZNC3_9NOCA|nr:hypothetical protein [Nocardia huaxiensis]QLY29665.1 hypothetical protein H0264_31215 [Nocardia huaxiensis]UFS96761.1 hypothetical protein LPY97_02165 [Nocardia huaxiensis]